MKQQQIDAFCTPAWGGGPLPAQRSEQGPALLPSSALVRLWDRAGGQAYPKSAKAKHENWVKIGLEGYPCPLGCSGVRWFEGERCPWLAAATLHGSWGYFGFWSNWNTKYEDFSLQPGLWGWLRVKLGWAASALLQPLETWGPSPRSAGVVLGAGARLEEQAATAPGGLKMLKTQVKAHWKECLAI